MGYLIKQARNGTDYEVLLDGFQRLGTFASMDEACRFIDRKREEVASEIRELIQAYDVKKREGADAGTGGVD